MKKKSFPSLHFTASDVLKQRQRWRDDYFFGDTESLSVNGLQQHEVKAQTPKESEQ